MADTYFTSYNDWYNGTRNKFLTDPGPALGGEFAFDELGNTRRGPNPYVNDEGALKTAMANDLRTRGGVDGLNDDQVMDAYKRMGGYTNVKRPESSFGDSLMEFAGPGSPLAWMASMIFSGGAAGGALAGASGSGATDSVGGKNTGMALSALNMANGAYNSPGSFGSTPSDAVAGSEYGAVNQPNDWISGPTGAGGGNGGNMDEMSWPEEPTGMYGGPTGMPLPDDGWNLMDLAKKYGPTAYKIFQDNKGLITALARGAPAAIGALGANEQAKSYKEMAEKYMALGAPSRDRYEASFRPGFTMESDPGYKDALDQSAKATLHGLSVQGNPAGSPNAWSASLNDLYQKTAYPALQNFRNTNSNAGGISTLTASAPGASGNAINAQAGVYNALGAGAADIFSPPKTLAEQLAELRRQGLY